MVAYCVRMDRSFRALADPVRRALIEELADRDEQTLFELCGRLMTTRGALLSRQAVSKHLAVLVDAGIVHVTARGRTRIHRLDRAALTEARAWLDRIAEEAP